MQISSAASSHLLSCSWSVSLVLPVDIRVCQSLEDGIDVLLRRRLVSMRLLLERVEHIDGLGMSDRCHRSVGISIEVVPNLDDLRFLEPIVAGHRFYSLVELTFLELVEAEPHHPLHVVREGGD